MMEAAASSQQHECNACHEVAAAMGDLKALYQKDMAEMKKVLNRY